MSDDARSALRGFLAGCRLLCEAGVIWPPTADLPPARFVVRAYAASALPPLESVTSVRCIVTRSDEVLVLSHGDSSQDTHIVPGGRREPGESLEQTLRRELLEETGWSVGTPRLLGCVVYRRISRRPPDNPFPYPEFAQLVYAAEAEVRHPEAHRPDAIDGVATFLPVASAMRLPMAQVWQAFLELAIRM